MRLVLLPLVLQSTLAAVIDVTPSDDLNAVLAGAGAGDELVLANGTYTPAAEQYDAIVIWQSVSIRARYPGQVVIDGRAMRRVIVQTREFNGSLSLHGLNITGGSTGWSGGGMALTGGKVIVDDCNFYENEAEFGGGVSVENGEATFSRCSFDSNIAFAGEAGGGGLLINGGAVDLDSCRVRANSAHDGGGLYVESGTVIVANTTISDNAAVGGSGGGVFLSHAFGPVPDAVRIDSRSTVQRNAPDDCYGFKSPACGRPRGEGP